MRRILEQLLLQESVGVWTAHVCYMNMYMGLDDINIYTYVHVYKNRANK